MKVVIQRASDAQVKVSNKTVGEISNGLVVLVGITHKDTIDEVNYLANKIVNLRIFEDEHEKMNLSLKDISGSILSISQFTLYGDARKGRRPNFMDAATPEYANDLYERFNKALEDQGIHVETGQFGAMMNVRFTNVGPVTLILDSQELMG